MKSLRITFFVVTVFSVAVAAESNAVKSFAALKSLQGSWEGRTNRGKPVHVVYRMTAGDSALMSEIESEGPENMISMFHVDNDRLLLTHYCSAGNQPRMQASLSPDGKQVTFDFVDGTNIPTPESGHMTRVVFTALDANHHTEEWVFADHGKEMHELFDLQRKK